MDTDEEFSADYFQHLLNSLTLNSRALITELTGLAEKYIDDANTIVGLIEDRIAKILPKYKLFSFYLMDSIVKNIGNPYNLMFTNNLYKNFTETYLIVTDTMTRQNLINLFKTWLTGKTSAGLDLFSHDVLKKIEEFIIKATSLTSAPTEQVRITRDTLLREGNYLLQYVIALDEGLEQSFVDRETKEDERAAISKFHHIRNNLIYEINTISEIVMIEQKQEFEQHKEQYATDLQRIRRALDDQSFQQQEIVKRRNSLTEAQIPLESKDVNIEINLKPKSVDILMILGSTKDADFESFVSEWGKSIVDGKLPPVEAEPSTPVKPAVIEDGESLAGSLGLNIASFNFQDTLMGSPKNEITHISSGTSLMSDDDDGDGYDPEESFLQDDLHVSASIIPSSAAASAGFTGKSSLKRSAADGDRVVKRVRFEI
ncbi:CIC11C00000000012 [Sungouiella intermedia]|uniref:CIC11C00000000012 n=1 Tax=Sungouiella intermedia TaxID=45354 RepID=A0A1L0G0Z8_9ASCO|nr:CIC11C00000000012 [[Candida] intermedia]